MTQQIINWIKNDGTVKPERHVHYLINTNWRKAMGLLGKR